LTHSFASLGVAGPIIAALGEAGISDPFPVQALTIPDALAGHDVCGEAATGSGKTVAFAVPVVQRLMAKGAHGVRPPRALVLVPTRELASQVVQVMRPLASAAGLVSAAFYGGVSLDKQAAKARSGVDVVVATPGRLIDLIRRGALELRGLEVAVIDEADRMADMGFMPQVEWLLRRAHEAKPQMLLFSATLDGDVDKLIHRYLRDPVRHSAAGVDATPDAVHNFLAVHEMDRVRVVAAIARGAARTMVFVRTRRGADRLATQLAREGVEAEAIHGDRAQPARERALRRFAAGTTGLLVATDVAARGIHVDAVDVVVHFDPPEDHKAYIHRSGRTARAGQPGVVATLVLWNQMADVERLKRRIGVTSPTVEVFSNDARLADLLTLADSPVAARPERDQTEGGRVVSLTARRRADRRRRNTRRAGALMSTDHKAHKPSVAARRSHHG
jgi:superfamily II DNA/RNA helicase